MSEHIDRVKIAETYLNVDWRDQWATTYIAHAQVQATLALAEQQRIANLVALVAMDPDGLSRSAYSALAVMSPDRQRTILDPDIAAALGIGDDDE